MWFMIAQLVGTIVPLRNPKNSAQFSLFLDGIKNIFIGVDTACLW
jgi:hypothetical protein